MNQERRDIHLVRGSSSSCAVGDQILSPPAKQTNAPVTNLQLLDVTIPHPPQSLTAASAGLDESLTDPKTIAELAGRSHLKAMRDKHQGSTTSAATQLDVIATIIEQNYALIPFTVNPLGRLGYTAHRFLGMSSESQGRVKRRRQRRERRHP
jgi:hypothetical protein